MQGVKNGVTPLGNEYFDNAAEGQNKAAEWVGYIFPVPLINSKGLSYKTSFLDVPNPDSIIGIISNDKICIYTRVFHFYKKTLINSSGIGYDSII